MGRIPASWEHIPYLLEAVNKQTTPFEISIPAFAEVSIKLELPEGYSLSKDINKKQR